MLEGQGPDNLRWYLTGAVADGGSQADPDASLGGARSATELYLLGVELNDAIDGLVVEAASGNCGTGTARLYAAGASSLQFAAPDGSLGTAVTIANGQTRILTDGSDGDQALRVSRTKAADLAGSITMNLVERMNNALGFDNVSAAENAAGDVEYRCVCLKNTGDYPVSGIKIWLASGTADLAIGLEQPSFQPAGLFTQIADEGSAPGGVSFYTPDAVDHPDVLSLAGLYPGHIVGLWMRRTIVADTTAAARIINALEYQFETLD